MRPAFLEIDLNVVRHNVRVIRRLVPEHTAIAAIVKANAYGHGGPQVARACLEAGAGLLCVAIVDEGIELRAAGLDAPVLILGPVDAEEAELYIRHDLIATLSAPEHAWMLAEAARRLGAPARAHVKLDTGMGRHGARGADTAALAQALAQSPEVRVEGIFSHLGDSCNPDLAWSRRQVDEFRALLCAFGGVLDEGGVMLHFANSAAIVRMPETHLDAVRPGAILYGLNPGFDPALMPPELRPVLSLRTRLGIVKTVEAGQPVGYNRTWTAPRDSRIAVLPLGYADGYPRALSNNADVLVGGRRCPLVGLVSMDAITVDVTEVPGATLGDEAVLIGAQGDERITVEELAARGGTIVEEIVARLTRRLPRVFLGEEVAS